MAARAPACATPLSDRRTAPSASSTPLAQITCWVMRGRTTGARCQAAALSARPRHRHPTRRCIPRSSRRARQHWGPPPFPSPSQPSRRRKRRPRIRRSSRRAWRSSALLCRRSRRRCDHRRSRRSSLAAHRACRRRYGQAVSHPSRPRSCQQRCPSSRAQHGGRRPAWSRQACLSRLRRPRGCQHRARRLIGRALRRHSGPQRRLIRRTRSTVRRRRSNPSACGSA